MSLTPEEITALDAWLFGPDPERLTVPQFRRLLTIFLREPLRHFSALSAVPLVRHSAFTHALLLREADALGTNLQLGAFAHIGRAYLLAQRDAGASVSELWARAYDLALMARTLCPVPSHAPRTDRIACTDLVEACHDIGVGGVGCACWGDAELAALLKARSQDLRELVASP